MFNKYSRSRQFLPEFPDTGKISLELLLYHVDELHNPSVRELGRYFVRYAENLEQEKRGLVLFKTRNKPRNSS